MQLPVRTVPDFDGILTTRRAGRCDALPVGVPGHGEDRRQMADEVKRLPAGHCVPDFDVRTVATGNNPPTVGTDREAPDFVAVPVEGGHFLALVSSERGRVPDADGTVVADRGKAPSVRAERRAPAHVL